MFAQFGAGLVGRGGSREDGLTRLITQRSQVQILSPLLVEKAGNQTWFPAFSVSK